MDKSIQNQTLYRFFDSEDNLLYVGISSNWQQRLKQHYKESEFHKEAVKITMTHYESREEVEAAERLAIANEGAKYNKAFNPNYESVQDHFQKLKAWVYGPIESDETHSFIVQDLKEIRVTEPSWDRKTSGILGYHFLENYEIWRHFDQINCDFCESLYHSAMLKNWVRYLQGADYAAY